MSTSKTKATKPASDNQSRLKVIWRKLHIEWMTTGKAVSILSVLAIGGTGAAFAMTHNRANAETPLTQPAISVGGNKNAVTGSGPAQNVSGDHHVTSQGGNATSTTTTNNAPSYSATANGPGGKALAGQTVTSTENNVDSGAIEKGLEGKPDDWQPHKVNTWLTDNRGDFIEVPFTPNRQTKITEPIALAPFSKNRKAVVELHNVTPEWQKKFAFQVKAMRLFGDQDRQDGLMMAGHEFTILRSLEGDQEYYLAWRGEGTKEGFVSANPDAVIVMHLLN
jgi:hypothetical protein